MPPGYQGTNPANFSSSNPRRFDVVFELPQSARHVDAEDDSRKLGERTMLRVPHRKAWAVPLGTSAGARELLELPPATWIEPRKTAGAESSMAVPAMPPRYASPRHTL